VSEQIGSGIYAGIPYIVAKKGDKVYIGLQGGAAAMFVSKGANMTLLDDIGDQDPDSVMEKLFDSLTS